jgi:DNA-binding transcriptional MerR regulator
MPESPERSERWLKPSEVSGLFVAAGFFRVPLSTLRAWSAAGRIASVRTAGGHRRYRETDAQALLAELSASPEPAKAVA